VRLERIIRILILHFYISNATCENDLLVLPISLHLNKTKIKCDIFGANLGTRFFGLYLTTLHLLNKKKKNIGANFVPGNGNDASASSDVVGFFFKWCQS
jgi:hypothetical protein